MAIQAITARQTKAARAVLGLSVEGLAERAGVSASSIRRLESDAVTLDLRAKVQEYFEREGLRFTVESGSAAVSWPE